MDVLAAVRRDRPLITTWLEAGMLLEVAGKTVRLGFPPEQKMAMESLLRPNNRVFLEKLFTQLIGGARVRRMRNAGGARRPAGQSACAPRTRGRRTRWRNSRTTR